MFLEQKLPDIGGTLIGMSPKVNVGGTRPPCLIGIDATGYEHRRRKRVGAGGTCPQ